MNDKELKYQWIAKDVVVQNEYSNTSVEYNKDVLLYNARWDQSCKIM